MLTANQFARHIALNETLCLAYGDLETGLCFSHRKIKDQCFVFLTGTLLVSLG